MTIRRRFRLPLVCAAGLLPVVASAQGAATPSSVSVVTAVWLVEADVIRLDGVPDEAAWRRASAASGFLQRDPDNGAPATERTEVRLLYDAGRLILGVICHDSEPDRVLGNQLQRDQSFDADDRFIWTLDTFLDGRTGYFFEINPYGAMGDGLVGPTTGFGNEFEAGINRAWDGIWIARVRRSGTG